MIEQAQIAPHVTGVPQFLDVTDVPTLRNASETHDDDDDNMARMFNDHHNNCPLNNK